MKASLLLAVLFMSTLGLAQPSKATVTAHAKKRYPSYDISRVMGETLWEKNVPYYWWSWQLRKKVDLPGYPGVTEVGVSSAYFWGNGSLKQNGYYEGLPYEGMPDPPKAKLQVGIDNFDIPAYFGRDSRVIEVKDMKLHDDMEYTWYDEKNLHVKGAEMTMTRLGTGKFTETIRGEISMTLERDDYKSDWRIKSVTFVDYQPKIHEVTKKEYTTEEFVAIENSTYEFKFAEDIAKKEWESLIDLEIPFESPEQMSLLANKIFSTGTRDEVKAFLFKTTPSGKYWEGSEYRFDYSQDAFIDQTIKYIFDTEHNYQNEYCPTSVIADRTKYGYTFSNHSLTNTTKFKFMKDGDRYSLVDLDMYFSDGNSTNDRPDARKYPCRGEVFPELFEMPEAFCTVEFPAGMESVPTKPQRLKQLHFATAFDACNYDIYATWLDPKERSNAARASIAKNTGDNGIADLDGVIESSTKTFELNGVTGYETNVTYKVPNGIRQEVIRYILLGDVFYQIQVKAPKLRDNEIALLETFKSTLKGSSDNSADKPAEAAKEFQVGDYVIVKYDWAKTGKPQTRKGKIEEVMKPGMYMVLYYEKGSKQGMPVRYIEADPDGGKQKDKKKLNFKL